MRCWMSAAGNSGGTGPLPHIDAAGFAASHIPYSFHVRSKIVTKHGTFVQCRLLVPHVEQLSSK